VGAQCFDGLVTAAEVEDVHRVRGSTALNEGGDRVDGIEREAVDMDAGSTGAFAAITGAVHRRTGAMPFGWVLEQLRPELTEVDERPLEIGPGRPPGQMTTR
jgi:hypothetical protein